MYLFYSYLAVLKSVKKVLRLCVRVAKLLKTLFYYRLFSYLRTHEKQVCYE